MRFFNLYWFFLRCILTGIFRLIYAPTSGLPPRIGRAVAKLLGDVCARLDLDWRTVGLRQHYVAERTRHAYLEIEPSIVPDRVAALVRERFRSATGEEMEGCWLARGRAAEFDCVFEGLDGVRAALASGRGIVLLTMHYDATPMGIAQAGLAGLHLNLMTSAVVEDKRISPSIRLYFAKKYAGIAACLKVGGGAVLHAERHMRSFYRALARGEGVVILGDAPTGKTDSALIVDFLGKPRAIAPGAIRLAEKMGSPVAAFVCLHRDDGGYRMVFSPVYWPENSSHSRNAQRLFGFLESWIRRHPERWWAADQLPNFACMDRHEELTE